MAKRPAKAEQKNGTARTEYIVLQQRETNIATVGHGTTVWSPVLNETAEEGPDLQPRIFKAASKTAAIRAHTGDGADILEGSWKAVPLSSWRGGETTRRVTASERLPLDA